MVAFSGAHVVVTGGTGALGSAVIAALRQAGAICHVTNLVAAELDHFSHKGDPDVHVTTAASTSPTRPRSSAFTRACRRCGRRSTLPAGSRWRHCGNLGADFERSSG